MLGLGKSRGVEHRREDLPEAQGEKLVPRGFRNPGGQSWLKEADPLGSLVLGGWS